MKVSIVIPVFNEEKNLPLLRERLEAVLCAAGTDHEIIVVNDGSTDQTATEVKAWIEANPRVSLLELSRNFGHQAAITAGLREAQGDAVIIMDADLQDPPEIIPELVRQWQDGNKIVLAERRSRGERGLRRLAFQLFYKIFEVLSDFPIKTTSGVFGLMDRIVVEHLLCLNEQNRFIPGLRSWLGFQTATVWYDRDDRATGKPHQSLGKLVKYGFDAIFSFSYKPLRFSFFTGLIISGLSFTYGLILFIKRILQIDVVPGFTTVAVAVFFLSGVILISNGIIGEYLARIYDEVKQRPLFIVARKISREGNDRQLKVQECSPPRPY